MFFTTVVLMAMVPWTTSSWGYHHGRENDFYGEYYLDALGRQRYIYCYDPRFFIEDHCRPRRHYPHIKDYPNGVSLGLEYYSSLQDQYYDGRGKINVGKGRFYKRGRDVYIECDFHNLDRIVSNIVWYRKSLYGGANKRYDRDFDRRRYYIQNVDQYTSRLIIRDYNEYDDGIYRCIATRLKGDRSYKAKETIFMETDVYYRSRPY